MITIYMGGSQAPITHCKSDFNEVWTCTGQCISQKKKCWQHSNFHFKSPPLVTNTQHGKFVLWQPIMATTNLPRYSARQLGRIVFWPKIMAICHWQATLYKIFILDDAGLVTCCQRQAGRNHSANMQTTTLQKPYIYSMYHTWLCHGFLMSS